LQVKSGDPSGAAAVVLDRMKIKPDHARRACREFESKKVIPRDLSINRHAFATTVESMRYTHLIKGRPQLEIQACVDLQFLDATEA